MVRRAQTFMLCTIDTVKRLRQLQIAESQQANNRRAGGI